LKTFGNIIIFEVHKNSDFKIVGSLVDALDYFITIYEYNKDIQLILLNSSLQHKHKLKQFSKKRYNLNNMIINEMFNNVMIQTYNDLMLAKIDKILLMDFTTVRKLRENCTFTYKDIHIIVEDGSEYVYKDAKYYLEIPIFGNNNFKSTPYNLKMRLDLLKQCKSEKMTYVNHRPNPCTLKPSSTYLEEHNNVIKEMNNLFGDKWFFKQEKPVDNVFDMFDTFLYYKSCDWFDTHPRLFIECYYLGKKIIYKNPKNIKDGSYYRYKDLIENGINHRYLDKDDIIVKEFI